MLAKGLFFPHGFTGLRRSPRDPSKATASKSWSEIDQVSHGEMTCVSDESWTRWGRVPDTKTTEITRRLGCNNQVKMRLCPASRSPHLWHVRRAGQHRGCAQASLVHSQPQVYTWNQQQQEHQTEKKQWKSSRHGSRHHGQHERHRNTWKKPTCALDSNSEPSRRAEPNSTFHKVGGRPTDWMHGCLGDLVLA